MWSKAGASKFRQRLMERDSVKVFPRGTNLAERKTLTGEAHVPPTDKEAQAVARYLADMTGQLETMARAAKLELLAYLLAMARAEAESAALDGGEDRKAR
jgi:hypothetical protein